MNLRYYHEFYGADDVLNRFEILTNGSVPSMSIEASSEPFIIDYTEVKKLEPIRGSQATLNLICNQIFQFRDLHTDDMQKYQVRFYRGDALYWIGWLDSETYGEALADTPPYGVTFKASDFNVTGRLKYFDESDKRYKDIVPFITHLKRCFNKLDLPFQKLYIGCTTTANDIPVSDAETALHVLYMMSDNFYDEDNEPMTCREVIESILQPFGLSMIQKDANVFIYDLNTVKQGLPMKRYDFASLNYEGEETINFNLGNLYEIGFMSTDSTYEFEEMINNVTITSSIYANDAQYNVKIEEDAVSDSFTPETPQSDTRYYRSSDKIENLKSDGFFVIYHDRKETVLIGEVDTVRGCFVQYTPHEPITPLFRLRYPGYVMRVEQPEGRRKAPYYLNLKVKAYPSTTSQPLLQQKVEGVQNSGVLKSFCNLYIVDENNKAVAYYNNTNEGNFGWNTLNGEIQQGKCILWFSNSDTSQSILDTWTTNAAKDRPAVKPTDHTRALNSDLVGKGLFARPDANGYLVFEITNQNLLLNPVSEKEVEKSKIKMILFDEIDISVVDEKGKSPSTDDYEFKSYVNKKVSSDYDELTLKCISANEEKAPVGKANILKKVEDHYEFQLSYSRSGQTDILERLLMCTIHSNFTTKNERCAVIIKMTENPTLSYVDYNPILTDKYLVTGCTLNFARATTNLSVVGFSEDTAKLSNIPYE